MIPAFVPPAFMPQPVAGYDAATVAWAAQVVTDGGTVSTTQKGYVDTLIVGLKTDGIWSKLDRLWLFASENTQQALRDIKAIAAATAVNSPAFAGNTGYTSNGTSSYIDTNFNASTAGGNYSQNSACFFAWSNTTLQETQQFVGAISGPTIRITPLNASNTLSWLINQGATNSLTSAPNSRGLYLLNRTASNAETADLNGSQIDTNTNASSALANFNIAVFKSAGGYSARQCCCIGFGSQLTSGDRTNIYSRLRTYMTSEGVP